MGLCIETYAIWQYMKYIHTYSQEGVTFNLILPFSYVVFCTKPTSLSLFSLPFLGKYV